MLCMIITKVNVISKEELQGIAISKVRKIKGIKSVLTLVTIKHSKVAKQCNFDTSENA
jgi:hypothetical protein